MGIPTIERLPYQRENEILIRKIDSSLTVEELLRHLSKGGGNSVVIGIK